MFASILAKEDVSLKDKQVADLAAQISCVDSAIADRLDILVKQVGDVLRRQDQALDAISALRDCSVGPRRTRLGTVSSEASEGQGSLSCDPDEVVELTLGSAPCDDDGSGAFEEAGFHTHSDSNEKLATKTATDLGRQRKKAKRKVSQMSTMDHKQEERVRQIGITHESMRQSRSFSDLDEAVYVRTRVHNRIKGFVEGGLFMIISSVLIVTNAIFLGVQVAYAATHTDEDGSLGLAVLKHIYNICFLIELALRIYANGPHVFFCDENGWFLNWVDVIVVTLSLAEVLLEVVLGRSVSSNIPVLRLIRVCRIVRILRFGRVMQTFKPLRILVAAISHTLKSAIWSLSLLLVIMYTFAIVFTQAKVDYDGQSSIALEDYFGTLPRAVFTLFKSLSGGVDWEAAVLPLSDVGWIYVFAFNVYIFFVYFFLMNVMTGLFVNSAMESAKADSASMISDELASTNRHIENLRQVFDLIAQRADENITLLEIEAALRDERVWAYFHALDIEITDAWSLFNFLDLQGKGFLNQEEFVQSCLRLRGPAKSVHVAQLLRETRWMRDTLVQISGQLDR